MACYSPRCDSPYPYADWDDCESVSSLGSFGCDYDHHEEASFQDPLAVGDDDVFEEPERVHGPIVDICKVDRMSEEEERMAIATRKAKEVAKELSETMSGKLRWLSDFTCDKPGPKRRKKKGLSMVDYPTLGSEAPAGSRIKMSKIGKGCTLVMASGGTRVEGSHPLVREFNGEKPPKNVGRKSGPAWFGYLSAKNATDKKTGSKQSDKEVEDDWTFVSKKGKGIQPEDAKPQGVKHQHAIRRDDRHRHGMRGTRYGAPNYGYRDQQQQCPVQGQQSRGQWQRRPCEGEGQWTQRRPAQQQQRPAQQQQRPAQQQQRPAQQQRRPAQQQQRPAQQQQRPAQQQQRPAQQPPQKPLRKRKPPPTNQRIVKPQKPKTPEPQPPQQDWFDSV
ncbi:surface protein [Frog virus 3]|uniref:Surface protein n=1 Tax=Frog virus 3 TaxID=10493 RepID=A0A5B8P0S6_FRG3V|nr:surface protein [Frog virus 3]